MSLSAANRSPIAIDRAFFAKLTTKSPDGRETSCRSMVYVSSSVHDMYLSYESLLNLGVLANGFSGGNSPDEHHQHESINQSINKLYLFSNLQCSTEVLISSSQVGRRQLTPHPRSLMDVLHRLHYTALDARPHSVKPHHLPI